MRAINVKNLLAVAVLGLATIGSTANAAFLSVSGSNGNYAIYLNGEATVFDRVYSWVTPDNGAQFQNINGGLNAGAPRGPGNAFTYRNRAIDLAPDDIDNPGIGKGWTLIPPTTVSANQVSFAGGPLVGNISTAAEPGGRLFLANVMLLPGAKGSVAATLTHGGVTVGSQWTEFLPPPDPNNWPEPATASMARLSLLGLAAFRRRK
jgi:hypothetical protein